MARLTLELDLNRVEGDLTFQVEADVSGWSRRVASGPLIEALSRL